MQDLYVWVRIGDNGDYEKFNSIEDAAEHIVESTQQNEIRWRNMGIEMPNYEGDNYISLYWGDDDAQPADEPNLSRLERWGFINVVKSYPI